MTSRNTVFAFAAAILFLAFALQLVAHARTVSATSDEPIHIIAGLRHLHCSSFAPNAEHPPLAKMLAALAAGPDVTSSNWPCQSASWISSETLLAIGGDVLAMPGGKSLLTRTRVAIALFSLILAACVFLAGWDMFGRLAALIALAMLAFEPTILAHGSLVTTDMAATATMFAFLYAVYRHVKLPSTGRLLVAGLCAGLMVATKHSSIVMLPVGAALLFTGRRRARDLMKDVAIIAVITVALLWTSYGFRFAALPKASGPTISIERMFATLQPEANESAAARVIAFVHRHHMLPEAYLQGLTYVLATSSRTTYILGQRYATGQWFYFPIALTVKTSLSLLLLLFLALITPRAFSGQARELLFLLTPALIFLLVAMTSNLNIGVRHVLPVYPFMIVLAAGAGSWLSSRSRAGAIVIAILVALHIGNALRTFPDYLAFSNELWGGTRHTYKVLHDSNADWGQDAYRVAEDARRHGKPCWYAHIGSGALSRETPCSPLPTLGWTATSQPIRPAPPVISGRVYLSVNAVPPRGDREYSPFRDAMPVAQIGGSTLVYEGRFDVPLLSAISVADMANWLLRQRRVAEALHFAERAVALAPREPRTHLALAAALRVSGRATESQQALATAARLIAEQRD